MARVVPYAAVVLSLGSCSSHRVLQGQPQRDTPSGSQTAVSQTPTPAVASTEQETSPTVAVVPARNYTPANSSVATSVSDVFADTNPPISTIAPTSTVPFSLVLDVPPPDTGQQPPSGQPTADPVALPTANVGDGVGVGSPKVRAIRGTYDLDLLLVSEVPLVMNPLAGPAPLEPVVGVVLAGSAAPVARTGDALLVSYQLLRWDTAEVADATAAGEPTRFILGVADDLAPAFSRILEGVTPGSQRVALFPVGTTGLPSYVPDDVAYLFVATISAVVPA